MDVQHTNLQRETLEKLIVEAEKSKIQMFNPTGNKSLIEVHDDFFHHSSHIDGTLIAKIEAGKFVELEKLIPKEKFIHSDGWLQMIYGDGAQFLQPVSEKDTPPINNPRRWEQAFDIYATIYTMKYPHRATEIFRYMFNIRSAATVYVWDNVYTYDITFRCLIEKNPDQNWGVIYQQGWTLLLREKLDCNNHSFNGSFSGNQRHKSTNKQDQTCWRFNKGTCTFGAGCRFEHKCGACNKSDHGSNSCPNKQRDGIMSSHSSMNVKN